MYLILFIAVFSTYFAIIKAGVLSGKLQYGTAFGGSKVLNLLALYSSYLICNSILSGRRHVEDSHRERIQLRWKGHADQWYYWGADGGLRLLWANLLSGKKSIAFRQHVVLRQINSEEIKTHGHGQNACTCEVWALFC